MGGFGSGLAPIAATPFAPFGVAFAGAVGLGGTLWWTPVAADVAAARAFGASRISIPVWRGADLGRLAPLASLVKAAGLRVHVVPHFDGDGEANRLLPYKDSAAYAAFFESVVAAAAAHLGAGDSIELWNEATYGPADGLGWSDVQRLYATLAPALSAVVRAAAPAASIVVPIPGDQSPEQAANIGGAELSLAAYRGKAADGRPLYDMLGAHLYPTGGAPLAQSSSSAPLALRTSELFAAAKRVGLPLLVTEVGALAMSPGVEAWLAEAAALLAAAPTAPIWWSWKAPAGAFDIAAHPTVQSAVRARAA